MYLLVSVTFCCVISLFTFCCGLSPLTIDVCEPCGRISGTPRMLDIYRNIENKLLYLTAETSVELCRYYRVSILFNYQKLGFGCEDGVLYLIWFFLLLFNSLFELLIILYILNLYYTTSLFSIQKVEPRPSFMIQLFLRIWTIFNFVKT